MRNFILVFASLVLITTATGCIETPSRVETPAVEISTVSTPKVSPTPIVCTDNPSDITLVVLQGGSNNVHVSGRGFKPGESLILVFTIKGPSGSATIELEPAQGVNLDGSFSLTESVSPPAGLEGAGTLWSVAVVHTSGVACATAQVR